MWFYAKTNVFAIGTGPGKYDAVTWSHEYIKFGITEYGSEQEYKTFAYEALGSIYENSGYYKKAYDIYVSIFPNIKCFRGNFPWCLLNMKMHIDNFKYYNDLNGHQKGDYVLKKMGKVIKENVRENDICARYGGEEFAIILPNTCEEDALKMAERLRMKIEDEHFEGEETQPKGKVTASFGVSVYPDKAKNDTELIKSADDALYRAKFFYKNRVEAYTSILDEIKSNIDEKDIELVTSVKTLIGVINAKDKYTYGHIERVVMYSRMMADKLNLSQNDKNILIYGAYMHDIGNCVNRTDHAHSGAILAYNILKDMGMPVEERTEIMMAIGNHDEATGTAVSDISAALILADKSDVHRDRVRNPNISSFDKHDKVNYAVTNADFIMNKEKRKVTLSLTIDTEICPVLDYFEIFMDRTMMSKYAAKYLNVWYELLINGTKLL